MTLPARMRAGLATVLAASAATWVAPAMAQMSPADTIFSQVAPSLRDRMFMRLNYVHANVKTTAGETYDVTGPVVGYNDIPSLIGEGSSGLAFNGGLSFYSTDVRFLRKYNSTTLPVNAGAAWPLLKAGIDNTVDTCPRYAEGLGTPCGVRARSQTTVGTPAISVGYFLDDAHSWVVEAFLLAAPLKVDVFGQGNNGLDGKNIIKTKLLPPTAILSHYFGAKESKFRPFVGVGGSYAIFFDTRATSLLNEYVGGMSANDTSVSIKNAFGVGPFAGFKFQLDDDWHINLNVGMLRYRTEATLITRNTVIRSGSAVLNDYGPDISTAIAAGDNSIGAPTGSLGGRPIAKANDPAGFAPGQIVPGVTALMCDLASAKAQAPTCNFGSFTRKQSTKLDNTLFMFSVGRTF